MDVTRGRGVPSGLCLIRHADRLPILCKHLFADT